jgi:hypothetical protein
MDVFSADFAFVNLSCNYFLEKYCVLRKMKLLTCTILTYKCLFHISLHIFLGEHALIKDFFQDPEIIFLLISDMKCKMH